MEFISNGKKFKREKKKRIFRLSSFRNFIKILLLISVLLSCFVFTSNNNLERSLNDIQDIEQVDRFFGLNPSTNDNFFKFIVGVSNNPYTIDPVDCWDSLSIQYIDQVCEGLYSYNLSDAELSIIPNLAADYGVVMINATDTWYTVELKTGIYFHDGYPFNATAVKFSFDRLQFLCNHTGLLPSHIPRATPHTVYEFTDGTPIINRTVILNSTAVRFELNKPFAPFQSLLCFFGSYILSPLSTNASGYINLGSDDLVGTGPFIYDRYDVDEAVRFHANDLYWRGKPKIEILELKIITDLNQRNNALIDGSIDLLDDPAQSFFSTFQSDPTVNFIDTGKAMNLFYYLSMNNNKINETWRQAISHAINYTCIIEKFRSGVVKRAKSPIPENMIYSNWTNNIATFNITKARELMQTMGYGVGWDTTYPGTAEGNWTAASFANFNYSYNLGSSFREKILVLLQNNLSKIGINVIDDGMDYSDFIQKLFDPGQYDYFELVFSGWGSDYNDPNSIVELLFSNTSSSNLALVNDAYLQDLINQGMIEYDAGTRRNIYNEIQRYLVEDLMPWAYCYSPINYDAYRSYVLGFQSNPIDKLVLYNVSRDPSYGSERIHIEGNQEWEFLKNASFCTGQGTRLDPYVIKDYVIDGQNAPLSCIQIENSDVFFRIENCTVFNSGAVGIELVNTSRGQIILNNCSNNYSGIYLDGGCFNNTLISNYIDSNSQYGIILNVTTGNFVFNNSFISNFINGYDNGVGNFWNNGSLGNYWDDYTGIDENDDGIGDSPYNVLGIAGSQDYNPIWFDGFEANLLIFLNGLNITLIEITPNALLNISVRYEERVSGNFISGASVGLSDGPISANLTENVILERYYLVINTSILGLGFHSIDISAQKENFASISIAIGVNVSSYIALSSFIIDDMGGGDYTWSQAETQSWCSGSGTISDPYHIQNLYLYGAYSSNCLTIRFSTAFFVISNCFFYQSRREEGYAGIKLENVSNGNLTGITCSDNENGIYLLSSEFITISESYIQNNRHAGIILNGSSYNLIVDNQSVFF